MYVKAKSGGRGMKTEDLVDLIMLSVKAELIKIMASRLFRSGRLTPAKLVKEFGTNGFLDQEGLKTALVKNQYDID